MHAASAAMVRIAILGAAIAVYYGVLSIGGWGDGADASIGAGLTGFAGLALLSLGWAFMDARTRGMEIVVVLWSVTAAVVAIAWGIVVAVIDADSGQSAADVLVADLPLTFFFAGLVLVPAVAGALAGQAFRRANTA